MPAQHRDDPKNIKLYQPKAQLGGPGLEEGLTAGVTFTWLFGQGKVTQANFNINQYFKNEEAPD